MFESFIAVFATFASILGFDLTSILTLVVLAAAVWLIVNSVVSFIQALVFVFKGPTEQEQKLSQLKPKR